MAGCRSGQKMYPNDTELTKSDKDTVAVSELVNGPTQICTKTMSGDTKLIKSNTMQWQCDGEVVLHLVAAFRIVRTNASAAN